MVCIGFEPRTAEGRPKRIHWALIVPRYVATFVAVPLVVATVVHLLLLKSSMAGAKDDVEFKRVLRQTSSKQWLAIFFKIEYKLLNGLRWMFLVLQTSKLRLNFIASDKTLVCVTKFVNRLNAKVCLWCSGLRQHRVWKITIFLQTR